MKSLLLCGFVALALPALSFGQGVNVEYAHLDGIGNVIAVSNSAGVEIESHDYLPFAEEWCGTAVCGSVKAGQSRRFTGKERDAETGLDYFGARYFSSKVGRFTTIDPVFSWKENLVDPQRWNRYAYVRNNPLKFVDPDGRNPVLMMWLQRLSPYADRAIAAGQRYGQAAYTWVATQLMANPQLPAQVIGAGAELASGASLPFGSGDIITREFKTAKGVVEMAAEAVIDGKRLHLKDIAVFPRAAERLDIGASEVRAMREKLAEEARGLGFEQLRITGTRVSGAKPGKAVDVSIDLKDRN